VGRVVGALSGSGYTFEEDGALMLDANRIVNELDLRRTLGLSPEVAVPPLTLMRKDKTTLYITRDIAYTIMKFQQANKIVNVIGVEQKLVQLQLKLAISALLGKEKAQDLVHYAYGLVELPGVKMSRRRSMYITFDEIIEQAFEKAKEHVKQSEDVSAEEMIEVARKIALGAIRYAMLNTSSTKTITFTWDRVLSLEKNSGPFINYAFTRACGILRKVGPLIPNPNYSLLKDPLERFLILQIAKFPDTVSEAADQLQPERVASFANTIAEKFHEYYEKVRVIGAERPELTYARAYLIKALQIVLRNAASLLGIELSERM
jgi:arginyl-tRNA synthetase